MKKIKHILKRLLQRVGILPAYNPYTEVKSIVSQLLIQPRYKEGEVRLLEKRLKYTDAASTGFIIEELFEKEIYRFRSDIASPYIIDCGANIGLGVIYFKRIFPDAEVLAFEPDEAIFRILKNNVETYALTKVTLVKSALWNEETILHFHSEGADAGRVVEQGRVLQTTSVKATRLGSYLDRPVDLLKIDIEGAETTVLKDCKDKLGNVKRLFVEYHSFSNRKQELSELIMLLTEAGFRLNINAPGLVSHQPFVKIEQYNGMDMQLNIYAFREDAVI